MRLQAKLILSYVILITLPLTILGGGFYYASQSMAQSLARDNVLEIVKKNNQIIDERLQKIQENSLSLMVECDLFRIFDGAGPSGGLELLQADAKIKEVLNRYFSQSKDLYSVQLVTRAFLYGNKSQNTFSPDRFFQSGLYRQAAAQKGSMVWVPTYNYAQMYDLPELADANIEYRTLFSAVRGLNPSCVKNDVMVRPQPGMETPYLLLNFQDQIYTEIFGDSIPIKGARFFILAPNGTVVASQDGSDAAFPLARGWDDSLREPQYGTAIVKANGVSTIACYATSAVTGWRSVVLIPSHALSDGLTRTINLIIVTLGASLLALSMVFAYLISSKISSPVNKLLLAIKRVGSGDFNVKINVEGSDEFGHVLNRFNSMNEKIRQLIDENYVAKLREKETEIMALNVQLNPHFLYNTLNIIKWMAVYGEKEEVDRMLGSLSRMLHYTTDSRKETSTLREDAAWLRDYVLLMKSRFEQRFEVAFDIADELMDAVVPKLFLQPLVENSIIHGFQDMDAGGLITVYGYRSGDDLRFIVEDNGCGIDPDRLKTLLRETSPHIGLLNVDKRIKLRYGKGYGIEIESNAGLGTRITLTIPYLRHLE